MKYKMLGFLFFLSSSACAQSHLPKLYDFRCEAAGVSLKLPSGWKTPKEVEGIPFGFNNTWYQNAEILLSVQHPPIGDELEVLPGAPCSDDPEEIVLACNENTSKQNTGNVLKTYLGRLKKTYLKPHDFHFRALKSNDFAGNNITGKYLIYTFEPGDCGGSIKCIVFLFATGTKTYALTFASCPERFDHYSKLFFEIGNSFYVGN